MELGRALRGPACSVVGLACSSLSSLFPRAELVGDGGPPAPVTDVVLSTGDVQSIGTLPMHTWIRATGDKPSFVVSRASASRRADRPARLGR
jgi:hypothetical protein